MGMEENTMRTYVIRLGMAFVAIGADGESAVYDRKRATRFTHREANLWCLNHDNLQTKIELA